LRSVVLFFLNNILINRILIWIGKDHFIKRFGNDWTKNKMDINKSLQENVGFSHTPEVDEAVQKIHQYIQDAEKRYLNAGDSVLDIGCGVGLYLKDFKDKVLYGTDLNADFIRVCGSELPNASLFCDDYLNVKFPVATFEFVYSISVIEYVPPSKIQHLFNKIISEMKTGAILAIQYPHALSWKDKWYADLSYVSYHPKVIEKCLKQEFEILTHEHSFDKRKVSDIDSQHYGETGKRNFCNGMILIAMKKS
jgi:SAM-dependent methyltransferase